MFKKSMSLIFLITTFLLLIGTVYAWFTIGDHTSVDFIEFKVKDSKVESFLYIQKNDDQEQIVRDKEDITNILNLGIPEDLYRFRLRLKNNSDINKHVSVMFHNVSSHAQVSEVDLRDAYIIFEAKIMFGSKEVILTPNSLNPAFGYEEQPLKVNRFSNFLDEDNNLVLLSNEVLAANSTVDIIFNVDFDFGISNSAYVGYLEIQQLFIEIKEIV